MWHEITRKGLRIDKVSSAQLTFWENNMLVIRHNKGLYILEISADLIFSKNLESAMSFIPNSTASPVRDLSDLGTDLTNATMTEMIVDPALWSNNKQMNQDMLHFVDYVWIPSGYLGQEPAIATLNNVGNVDIYKLGRTDWVNVLDLSKTIVKKFGPEPLSIKDFTTLKKFIDLLETSSICLGPNLGSDSCCFVTTQKGGIIYIWKLFAVDNKLQSELLYEHNHEDEILSMICIPMSQNKFSIICCNFLGQLSNLQFKTNNTSITHEKTTCFWKYKDRMICNYVFQKTIEEKMVFIGNKNRHLIIVMMDFDGNVVSEVVHNVNDYKICHIQENNGSLYVTLSNNEVVQIAINYNNLQLQTQQVKFEEINANFLVHSFGISKNDAITAAVVHDPNIKYKGRSDGFKLIFYSNKTNFGTEIDKLLQNETKILQNVCDCIELIRYKIINKKIMPEIDYNKLYNEGQEDIYKLKVYYILQIIYNIGVKSSRIINKNLLPETSEEIVKGMITILHAKTHLTKLYDKYKTHKKLDDIELKSFVATKKYLLYYCRVNNKDINDFVSNSVLNIINKDISYECQCCDEILNGVTCSNGHFNMFCSLSFIPIDVDADNYLICPKCKATAREELYVYKPRCIFCDHHLKYSISN